MMLTVQIMIGSVEVDRTKGRSQSRYQGYTTGAHRSDAAMGQANASEDDSAEFLPALLIHTAVRKPTSTANATTSCGAATRSKIANIGSLKRKLRK
jgi:hypothetical protein